MPRKCVYEDGWDSKDTEFGLEYLQVLCDRYKKNFPSIVEKYELSIETNTLPSKMVSNLIDDWDLKSYEVDRLLGNEPVKIKYRVKTEDEKMIEIKKDEKCRRCGGKGYARCSHNSKKEIPNKCGSPTNCVKCKGSGQVKPRYKLGWIKR